MNVTNAVNDANARTPVIGLTGGIGSGKSTVAAMLSDLKAAVIDADRLNHEELNTPEVLKTLEQWWGPTVIGPDGNADRRAIRQKVASDPTARQRLEELVHPRIKRRRETLTAQYQADPHVRAIVWDIPLLYEVGWADQCQNVIFVEADQGVRLGRVANSRQWSADDLERFENAQLPVEVKRERADYNVTNNSDLNDLRRQVENVFDRILADR